MPTGDIYYWNTSSAATTSITLDGTWGTWNNAYGSAAWTTWNSVYTTGDSITTYWPPVEQTPEERAALVQQQQEWVARERERQRIAAEAMARAEALLHEGLSDEQRAELKRERYFTVESRTSKRRYRIHAGNGVHGNIKEVDEQGRAVASLCCAPKGAIPEADGLLGQKLFLEHAEDEFRKTANITPLQRAG